MEQPLDLTTLEATTLEAITLETTMLEANSEAHIWYLLFLFFLFRHLLFWYS